MDKKFIVLFLLIAALVFEVGFWVGRSKTPARFQAVQAEKVVMGELADAHHSTIMASSTYDAFFNADPVTSTISESVVSVVVPHHLLAGRYEANFFKKLSTQRPEVVVLVGPNHPNASRSNIIVGSQNWRTPYGELSVDNFAVQSMSLNGVAKINDDVIGGEHSIGAIVPFIKKTWPSVKLIPIIVKSTATHAELDALRNELYRLGYGGKNTLVIASVDFSHYLPERVASFHDELSENILATGDIARLKTMEVDSEPSLYFLLSYNKSQSAESFHTVYHTNSATIANRPDAPETTSHILGYFTSGAPTAKPLISLQFFGDIMLDRNVARVMGTSGLDYIFKDLKGGENRFFQGADLFIPNLEGPFAPTRIPTSKTIAFRFDPKLAAQLKKYNFGAVTLANNHTVDMGWKNVAFTENLLATSGIHYFGREYYEGPEFNWVTNEAQAPANSPVSPLGKEGGTSTPSLTKGGQGRVAEALQLPEQVAFVAFETVDHKIDKDKVLAALQSAKQKARYIIAVVHGGTEYRRTSTKEQQELYHWLVDNGATAVVAHHPHVVEEAEVYHSAPILYSLGNFVFDQYFSKDTQQGLSVGLTLQDGKVKSVYFFPLQSVRSQVSLMKGALKDEFMKWMGENSRLEGRSIFNDKITLTTP